jgi:phosphatidyl-myo-inositol dimannoside synthase
MPRENTPRDAVMLLATEAFGSYGGVQSYMRLLIRFLEEDRRGEALRPIVLVLNDGNRSIPQPNGPGNAVWNGCGRKLPYVIRALRDGIAQKPRVVIAGHIALAPLAWLLRLMGAAKSFVVVLHGIESWKKSSMLTRLSCRRANAIVATTQYTTREFCHYNEVPVEKIRVIPLSTEESVAPRPVRDPSERPFRLLSVARLSAEEGYKGIDTLLQAVQWLLEEGRQVHLDIAGDGTDRTRLEQLASQLGVTGQVTFHGHVTPAELEQLYARAHLFAMPSRKEGFGIVFLEAMQRALPALGANHGGTPEVIEHTVNGFLVECDSPAEIGFYVAAVIDSPPLYTSLSESAVINVQRRFSAAGMLQAWARVVASL